MAKRKAKKRAAKYNQKVAVQEGVTFDDLMNVAVKYQPKKKAAPKKKKRGLKK